MYFTHWGQHKMTTTLQTFKCFFLKENVCILIFHLIFCPMGLIYSKSPLVQVMAWHWTGYLNQWWQSFLTHINIGFNHGVLGLAENPARGTGFWSQHTEGVARGVLTEKARPEGWVFSQAQHPMIKTYYSMSLHPNTAIIVFKLLAIVEWKRQRADISSGHCC